MGTKAIKKISVKTVYGSVKLPALIKGLPEGASIGPEMPLMEIVGICRDYSVVATDKGESLKFVGQFKATNLETGEIFVSGACFLPGALPDMLYGAIGPNRESDVQFAFRISAHYDESAITKYVYDVESLIPISESDSLALLEKQIQRPALAAVPESAPQPQESKKSQRAA